MGDPFRDVAALDMLIQTQPILWARAMLDEAEKVKSQDARDAILSRIGVCLWGRFAISLDMRDMRQATTRWDMD